jgi:hypothetical protein
MAARKMPEPLRRIGATLVHSIIVLFIGKQDFSRRFPHMASLYISLAITGFIGSSLNIREHIKWRLDSLLPRTTLKVC